MREKHGVLIHSVPQTHRSNRRSVEPFLVSVLVCLIMTGILIQSADAGTFECGFDENAALSTLPATGGLRIKFVFVSFNEDVELTEAEHKTTTEMVSWYLEEQSHGNVTMTSDSGIVFRPGEGFASGDSTPYAWRAEKSPYFYRVMDTNDPAHYEYVYGQNNDGWQSRCGTWWVGATPSNPTGLDNKATHLNAEIFWKIRDALPVVNPFDAPSGEVVDLTIMIYLTAISPFGDFDGEPYVRLNTTTMKAESDYFDDLAIRYAYSFLGTSQIQYTLGGTPPGDPTYLATASAYSTLHEIFHNWQLFDGPPNLYSDLINGNIERHYYYGYNNLMCQHLSGFDGIPGLGLQWLSKMETYGWIDVEDFTGQNLKRQKIYDIRAYDSNDSSAPKGTIYKFSRTDQNFTDEHFLIGFHGGMGIDIQDEDDNGLPMIHSNGLEIYHCVGTNMSDIESSFGMFTNITATEFPSNVESLDPSTFLPTWGTSGSSAKEIGRDNYDYWESSGQPRTDFASHPGYVFDFFSDDLGAYFQWEKPEFSFNSNPHCYWYESHTAPADEPFVMMRTNPQNVPNSMVVRIREQHNEANPPYAIVDFLSAPYEDLLSPGQTEHEFYQLGDSIEITWADHYGDDITKVEISYSTDDGITYELIATIDPAIGIHSYTWSPGSAFDSGGIKLLFYNGIVASNTCEETNDFSFSVVDAEVYYRTPIDPINTTGLDYLGTPYSVVEWDYLNSGDETKDIFISITDEASKLYQGTGFTEEGFPEFDEVPIAFFEINNSPQSGLRGLSVADLDNDGKSELFAAHETEPRLYRMNELSGKIDNVANELGLEPNANNSIAGVWGHFDDDRFIDLFVCRAPNFIEEPLSFSDPGLASMGSILFTNAPGSGAEDRIFTTSPSAGLPDNLGSITASWCDFDGDKDMDLFVGSLYDNGEGASRLYRNDDGIFTEVTSNLQSNSITMVTACAWADMNGDQTLDLAITRNDQPAAIYFNDGSGNFSDGNGGQAPFILGSNDGFSGLAIYDFDLDRDMDFLALSNSDQRSPVLYENKLIPGFLPQFEDITNAVGLSDQGYVHGALAMDFGNAAGERAYPDLFLGRPTASGKFYFKGEPTGNTLGMSNHFVAIRLESETDTDNSSGIGATVLVTSGSTSQIQLVDGGSMRGTQSSRDLVFGLSDYQGSVTATVTWPSGIVQTNIPLMLDQLNTISLVDVQVDDATVVGKYILQASGLVDWEFKWDVNILGDAQVNEVIFNLSSLPAPCEPEEASISLATSNDVDLSVTANSTGGFTNILTWRNRPCVPKCNIPFRVKSGHSLQTDTSDSDKNLSVKVCIGN